MSKLVLLYWLAKEVPYTAAHKRQQRIYLFDVRGSDVVAMIECKASLSTTNMTVQRCHLSIRFTHAINGADGMAVVSWIIDHIHAKKATIDRKESKDGQPGTPLEISSPRDRHTALQCDHLKRRNVLPRWFLLEWELPPWMLN
jgi:hypothetical protein